MIFMMNEYALVASGEKWIGEGIKSSANIISDLIDLSYNSLTLTIFLLFDPKIWIKIKSAVERRVKVEIFIYEQHDTKYRGLIDEVIEYSFRNPSYLKVHKTNDDYIHSKVIIADGSKVYLGSANLTQNGLSQNYELGVFVKNKDFAFDLEKIIRRLIE